MFMELVPHTTAACCMSSDIIMISLRYYNIIITAQAHPNDPKRSFSLQQNYFNVFPEGIIIIDPFSGLFGTVGPCAHACSEGCGL
jgi:hypothetical protein